jgi:predicted DNA-binding WGR domain protein
MSAMESAYLERDVDAALSLVIRFERVRKDRTRFYAMRIERDVQLTLDGNGPGFVLFIIRGRVDGPKPTVRRHLYRTLARAVEKWGELCARRRAHGYVEKEQHA